MDLVAFCASERSSIKRNESAKIANTAQKQEDKHNKTALCSKLIASLKDEIIFCCFVHHPKSDPCQHRFVPAPRWLIRAFIKSYQFHWYLNWMSKLELKYMAPRFQSLIKMKRLKEILLGAKHSLNHSQIKWQQTAKMTHSGTSQVIPISLETIRPCWHRG